MRTEYAPPAPVPPLDADTPTRLVIGDGVLVGLGAELVRNGMTGRAFVVADETVAARHGSGVLEALGLGGVSAVLTTFPPGEGSKSLAEATRLYAWLAEQRAERRDVVVALGGGVAGDLAGFVAATWLRGVPLVQVPTTLLSMVDSSVGGKVAVNLPVGKNLVGAFHPSRLTCIDVRMLDGLPHRDVRSGWAEVIKTAAIFDPDFFEAIAAHDPVSADVSTLAVWIERAVRWKARTVFADPREHGVRVVLNFGHTIAHAIEATAGYGAYLHGEAVAIGMIAASRLSVRHAGLAPSVAEAIEAAVARAGLPTRLGTNAPPAHAILTRTHVDKKVEAKRVRWVLLAEIGRCVVTDDVPTSSVEEVLAELSLSPS